MFLVMCVALTAGITAWKLVSRCFRSQVVIFVNPFPSKCEPRFLQQGQEQTEGVLALKLFDSLAPRFFLDVTVVIPSPPEENVSMRSNNVVESYIRLLLARTDGRIGNRVTVQVYGAEEDRGFRYQPWHSVVSSLPREIDLALFISTATPLEEHDVDQLMRHSRVKRVVCTSTIEGPEDVWDRQGTFDSWTAMHYLTRSATKSAHVFQPTVHGKLGLRVRDMRCLALQMFFECPQTMARWFCMFSRCTVPAASWAMHDVLHTTDELECQAPAPVVQAVDALVMEICRGNYNNNNAFDCIERACRSITSVVDFRVYLRERMRDKCWDTRCIDLLCAALIAQLGMKSEEPLRSHVSAPGVITAALGAHVLHNGDVLPDFEEQDESGIAFVSHRTITASADNNNVFLTTVRDGTTLADVCNGALDERKMRLWCN